MPASTLGPRMARTGTLAKSPTLRPWSRLEYPVLRIRLTWGAVALRVAMFGVPIAVMLYAVVTYEREASRRPPALLVALGDWSYSTYLFHFMVMSAVGRAVQYVFAAHTGYASVVLFVSSFLAANLAAAVIFMFFERPMLRWLYSRGRPEVLRAATPVAGPIGE